jgi:hypothetical protein
MDFTNCRSAKKKIREILKKMQGLTPSGPQPSVLGQPISPPRLLGEKKKSDLLGPPVSAKDQSQAACTR